MNKFLVVLALLFQVAGIAWGFVFHLQNHSLNQFFEQTQWPIFLGFTLLMVAVFNGLLRSEPKLPDKTQPIAPENPHQENPPQV